MNQKKLSFLLIFAVFVVGVQFALADATRATAPNASEITTAMNNGMDSSFDVKNSKDTTETGESSGILSTTTPISLLNTAISSDKQKARFQQNIVVHNLDFSEKICVFALSNHAINSCSSSSGSCFSDDNTRKSLIILPRQSRSLRFGGDVKLCALSTANGIGWQAERYFTAGK